MDINEFLVNGTDYFLPNLSIDLVIIGYKDNQLQCLLLRIGDKWLLPGGYIGKKESVNEAAERILRERTSLEDPHFRFLSVFGDNNRQFSSQWKEFLERSGRSWSKDYWLNDRFVSLAYYSLVNIENIHPAAGNHDEAIAWFNFNNLPEMWMDHKSIVLKARDHLKKDIKQEPVSINLLPDEFTMPELHQLHQIILDEKLDRSRFQKKMLSTGIFERRSKLSKESPGRNPYQYRIKKTDT